MISESIGTLRESTFTHPVVLNLQEKLLIFFVKDEISALEKGYFFQIETQIKKEEISYEVKLKVLELALLADYPALLETIYLSGKIREAPSIESIRKAEEASCTQALAFLHENGFISLSI